MALTLREGTREYLVSRSPGLVPNSETTFASADSAALFLRRFRNDAMAMDTLRRILKDELNSLQSSQLDNDAVIQAVGQALSRGRIFLVPLTPAAGPPSTAKPPPPVQVIGHGMNLNAVTAGTGGIERIEGRALANHVIEITITGTLKAPLNENSVPRAPRYNRRLPPATMILAGRAGKKLSDDQRKRFSTYELAHLWGPGFGDEAWDGIMYAPREVNQEWQNHGVEERIRDLTLLVGKEGGVIELTAVGRSHPWTVLPGYDLLASLRYEFGVRSSTGARETVARIEIEVPPLEGTGRVEAGVTNLSSRVF